MPQSVKDSAERIVEDIREELLELSQLIHANPELGFEEYKAVRWQTELLAKYGFGIEKPYCELETAYRASVRRMWATSPWSLPTIHDYIAIAAPDVVGHTDEFQEASRSPRADHVVLLAAKALALTAWDIATDESLRLEINNEFERDTVPNRC